MDKRVTMTRDLFPERIETSRLVFERMSHDTVDPFELYEFVRRDEWHGETTEHMPWFRLDRLDQVAAFLDRAEQMRADHEGARYLLRTNDEERVIVGTTAYKRVGATARGLGHRPRETLLGPGVRPRAGVGVYRVDVRAVRSRGLLYELCRGQRAVPSHDREMHRQVRRPPRGWYDSTGRRTQTAT